MVSAWKLFNLMTSHKQLSRWVAVKKWRQFILIAICTAFGHKFCKNCRTKKLKNFPTRLKKASFSFYYNLFLIVFDLLLWNILKINLYHFLTLCQSFDKLLLSLLHNSLAIQIFDLKKSIYLTISCLLYILLSYLIYGIIVL